MSRLLWKIVSSYGAISCVNSLGALAAMKSGPYALAGLSFKRSFEDTFICDIGIKNEREYLDIRGWDVFLVFFGPY